MLYMYFSLLLYLAIIALVIFILYRIIDNWIGRIINVRRDQNEALREIADAIRIREKKAQQ